MPLEWSNEYTSGDAQVDNHHIQIFDFVNQLGVMIESHPVTPMNKPDMDSLLLFMERYVRMHFEYEEECMFRHQCPVADSNIDSHHKFLTYFTEFMQDYEQTGPELNLMSGLHEAVSDWLTNHILKIDTELKHCIQS